MYLSFRWRIAHQAGRGRTPAECPEIQHHTCHPSLVATVVAVVLKADTGERRGRFLPQKEMQLLLTEPTPPPSSLKIIRPTKSPDCRGSTDGARLARRSVPAAICCVSCPMELSTLAAVPLTQTVSLLFSIKYIYSKSLKYVNFSSFLWRLFAAFCRRDLIKNSGTQGFSVETMNVLVPKKDIHSESRWQ